MNGDFAIEARMHEAITAISSDRIWRHANPVVPRGVERNFDAAARAGGAMLNGDGVKAAHAVHRVRAARSGRVVDAIRAASRFVGMEFLGLRSRKEINEAALTQIAARAGFAAMIPRFPRLASDQTAVLPHIRLKRGDPLAALAHAMGVQIGAA